MARGEVGGECGHQRGRRAQEQELQVAVTREQVAHSGEQQLALALELLQLVLRAPQYKRKKHWRAGGQHRRAERRRGARESDA